MVNEDEVRKGLAEVVRLLSVVTPTDQNKMIAWAVKSKDTTYTYCGAALMVAQDTLLNLVQTPEGC